MSFSVIQRTREIGIRRALGATAGDIVQLIVRHHGTLVGVGLVLGLTVGVLGAMILRAFLTGVGPTDPRALAGTLILVAGTAAAASVVPALRATRHDPIAAVREP